MGAEVKGTAYEIKYAVKGSVEVDKGPTEADNNAVENVKASGKATRYMLVEVDD